MLLTPRQVGLVLDLTNTWRYYDPKDWLERGIEHLKVAPTYFAWPWSVCTASQTTFMKYYFLLTHSESWVYLADPVPRPRGDAGARGCQRVCVDPDDIPSC